MVLFFIVDVTAAVLRGIGSLIVDITTVVLNGKYISIKVSTLADAQEVIVGRVEGQVIELPNGQGSAVDDVVLETIPGAFDTSDDDRASLCSDSEGVEVQAELTNSSADGQTCVGVDSEDPLPVQSETIDAPADQQAYVGAGEDEAGGLKSETLETPADDSDSRTEANAGVDVEYKSSVQKDTTAQKASSDGVVSVSTRKAIVASTVCNRTTARNVAGVPRRRRARVSRLKKKVGRDCILQPCVDEQAVADNVVGLRGDVPASNGHAGVKVIRRNGSKKQGMKTRRLVRSQITRRHSHRRELSGICKSRVSLLKVTLRSLGAKKSTIRRVLSGVRRGVETDSRVEFEGRMTGLVFDTPEQAMIGSDSEAEMEIDDETPTVGDDKVLAGDPMDLDDSPEGGDLMDLDDSPEGTDDSMDLDDSPEGTGDSTDVNESQDGPRSETADTGNSSSASATANGNSMAPTQDGQRPNATEAGGSCSVDGNQGRNPGKVNQEKLQERLGRAQAEAALRQTSVNAANSVATGSHSDSALAQPTQEHATPVSTSEASNTAPRGFEGAAQPLDTPHRAEDLKEARRGKKPETKAVPEEVEIPTPSPEEPVADVGVQSAFHGVSQPPASTPVSTGSPEATATSHPDTSDTTSSSAITPTSTLPSSAPSTAPTSPQTTTPTTSESSSAGSATTGDEAARKRKVVKRRSDDKKPRANPNNAKSDQAQDEEDQDTPTTSSKRSHKTRPGNATGEQEAQFAAPMTQAEIDAQILEAQFDTQPDSDTDLEWPSDED